MFTVSFRRRNVMATCLIVYCFMAAYYIGFFSPNAVPRAEEVQAFDKSLSHKVTKLKPSARTMDDIVMFKSPDAKSVQEVIIPRPTKSESNLLHNDILQKVSTEKEYFHPLIPSFPLSGSLKSPTPGFQLGQITRNANVIIGIPTVKRSGASYLKTTIDSLLANHGSGSDDTKILIYVGETDEEFIKEQADLINKFYSNEVKRGQLQVISPPVNYYPNWDKTLESSFGDTIARVKWRSKQNLDQIFLMMYIYNLSPNYYLMMEDDVIASDKYMEKIMKFAGEASGRKYFFLSFCKLGAIGKLFRVETLPSYASFIHMFWNKKPLDWLQLDYTSTAVCSYDENSKECERRRHAETPAHNPSLFQHIGSVSSLQGKVQNLKDGSFRKSKR